MAASNQWTPTFSFSNGSPGIDEDDLLRAQRLLGGSYHGDYYRQPWDAEPGLPQRPPYAPAPVMARYREEMMEMVRRSGVVQQDGTSGQEAVVCYELSLRDIVELPSAARALRESAAAQQADGAGIQGGEKPRTPAVVLAEEMGKATAATTKKAGRLGGRKRDVFRGQKKLESGTFMLKMFFFLPSGVLGSSSRERQRRKEAARSKVTPAPKVIWCDGEKCSDDRGVDAESWEGCCDDRCDGKASRSSSGGGSDATSGSNSILTRRRRFSGCYSFLHSPRRDDNS